jgi:hypothetical protein
VDESAIARLEAPWATSPVSGVGIVGEVLGNLRTDEVRMREIW